MEVETMATELPMASSVRMTVDSNPANEIGEGEFLSKDRNLFDLDD